MSSSLHNIFPSKISNGSCSSDSSTEPPALTDPVSSSSPSSSMALQINPTNLGLHSNSLLPPTPLSSPRALALRSPGTIICSRRRRNLHICRSSLVDEVEGTSSFTEPETQLIEALIGVQGRGRSASPEQLKVSAVAYCIFQIVSTSIRAVSFELNVFDWLL